MAKKLIQFTTFKIVEILNLFTLTYNINIIPINSQQNFFFSKKYLEKAVQGIDLYDIKVNCKTREIKQWSMG